MNGRRGFLAACLAAVCAPMAALAPKITRPQSVFPQFLLLNGARHPLDVTYVCVWSKNIYDESGRYIASRRGWHITGPNNKKTYRVTEYPLQADNPYGTEIIRCSIPCADFAEFTVPLEPIA